MLLLRLTRPLLLILAALNFTLGAGVANYLGEGTRPDAFWLGLIGVVMAQLAMNTLTEVFRPFNEPIVPGETIAARRTLRNNLLYLSIGAVAAAALTLFVLSQTGALNSASALLFAVSLLAVLGYAVPPFRLLDRGFGEFVLAAHLAYVIPSIGFLVQAQEYHRLLALVTIPLTAMAFAYLVIVDFPSYAADQKYERRNLLTILGWQRAIPFHHALLIAAYSLFAVAPFLGFSLQLLWPVFITLPFALIQISALNRIGAGEPPNWPLVTASAVAVFGLNAYLLAMRFWLR